MTSDSMTQAKSHPLKINPWFDLLRSIACLMVVTGHIRNIFFVDYPELAHPHLATKLIYFVTGLGHQAVMIFFVLSGLLVGGNALRDIQQGTWSWKKYTITRCSRLLIVLWPALLLTWGFDSLGKTLFGTTGIYGHHLFGTTVIALPIENASSAFVFICNAFFLQGIFSPSAGSNGPLWSLSFEFWYYILFPAICLIFSARTKNSEKTTAFFIFIFIFILTARAGMLEGFCIWLMGIASSIVSKKYTRFDKTFLPAIVAGLTLVVALIATRTLHNPTYNNPLIGLAGALLCYGILKLPKTSVPIGSKVFQTLSAFSFTLYLTHMPLIVFIRGYFGATSRWQPTIQNTGRGVSLCILSIAWAYLIYRLTEIHTPRLRQLFLYPKGAPLGIVE